MTLQKSIDSYLNQVSNTYIYQFDVYRDHKLGNFPLHFMALYKRRDEKYMISKKVKVWGVENQQFIFATTSDGPVTMDFFQQFSNSIQQTLPEYIPDKQDHMSTVIVGVIVTEHAVDDDAVKGVIRYRKLKFFKYGWHGWAEMYVGIVCLQDNSVYINPKGRAFIEPFVKKLNQREEQQ